MAWGNLALSVLFSARLGLCFARLGLCFARACCLLKISRFAIQLPCFDFVCESTPKKLLLKINKIGFGFQKS